MAMELAGCDHDTSSQDELHHHHHRRMAVRSQTAVTPVHGPPEGHLAAAPPVRLTLWCKSLLFNGDGYTVYDDSTGRMVFRVDNYAHKRKEETVLMDSDGKILLTIRRCRKKLCIADSWEAYKGDKDVPEIYSQKQQRPVPLFKATKALGNSSFSVMMMDPANGNTQHRYHMNWSRQRRCSTIYAATTSSVPVAEVYRKAGTTPKTLLGKDVLTMSVQQGIDQALVMAMFMITDAMS